MKSRPVPSTALRLLLPAAAFVVVVAGMRTASSILVPVLLAAFIAIIVAPLQAWLLRVRVPQGVALLLVVALILGCGTAAALLVGSSLVDFSAQLPLYQHRLRQVVSDFLEQSGVTAWPGYDPSLLPSLDPSAVLQMAASVLNGLSVVLTNSFLVLFTMVFILMELPAFPNKLRVAFRGTDRPLVVFRQFVRSVNQYLVIKTAISLVTGTLAAVWCALLGVDYPLLWGTLAFVLNYVPNIGSIVAAVPPFFLGMVQEGVGLALMVGLGYLVINQLLGNIIEPRVMGQGMGLSTLVVFLSLVFWGWVLGSVGMLLSVPLTMIVKIGLESSPGTRWMAVMLGNDAQTRKLLPTPAVAGDGQDGEAPSLASSAAATSESAA